MVSPLHQPAWLHTERVGTSLQSHSHCLDLSHPSPGHQAGLKWVESVFPVCPGQSFLHRCLGKVPGRQMGLALALALVLPQLGKQLLWGRRRVGSASQAGTFWVF
jgi:hypothetical protein